MTLEELRSWLSWLRENGANINRRICEGWICEFLSDKTEISRDIFYEFRKYLDISYCKLCSERENCLERKSMARNFELLSEEEKNQISCFEYKVDETQRRRIKIKD